MTLPRRALLAAPALLLPACTRAAGRMLVADLPLTPVEGYLTVRAGIAGTPVRLVVDTGAEGMLVTPDAARALGLPLVGAAPVEGTGGNGAAPVVELAGLMLGEVRMPRQVAPVVPLPVALQATPPIVGLLGASLLARFDLLFDAPALRLALYAPSPAPAPLRGPGIPLATSPAGAPYVPVHVNGVPLTALVDTGSRATVLTTRAAAAIGLSAPLSANTAPGIDGNRLPLGHTSARLAIGPLPERDAPVSIAPLDLAPADLILGLDQLARAPFFLAYAARTLVIAA